MIGDHLKPYVDAMAAHGPGFDATLWRSPAAQQARFEVAVQMLPCGGMRVADLGCGTGDLASFLLERGLAPAAYLGVDAQQEMVDAAQRAADLDVETSFQVVNLAEGTGPLAAWKPDVCVISGTLNTMTQQLAIDVVGRAFEASRVGVVFNFLSDRPHERFAGKDTSPASRFATIEVLDWCLSTTPRVQLRQDYLDGHDATIAMTHVRS